MSADPTPPLTPPRTIRIWAVYRSPFGAPADYYAQSVEFSVEGHPHRGEPLYGASPDRVSEMFDHADLEWHEPRELPDEPPNLIGTWEPRKEPKK